MNTLPAFPERILNQGQLLHPAHRVTGIRCPHCSALTVAFTQPALLPGRADRLYVNCLGYDCPGASTLPVAEWLDAVLPLHACVEAEGEAA